LSTTHRDNDEIIGRADLNDIEAILAVTNTDVDEVLHAVKDNADALFTWDYTLARPQLRKLYEKAPVIQVEVRWSIRHAGDHESVEARGLHRHPDEAARRAATQRVMGGGAEVNGRQLRARWREPRSCDRSGHHNDHGLWTQRIRVEWEELQQQVIREGLAAPVFPEDRRLRQAERFAPPGAEINPENLAHVSARQGRLAVPRQELAQEMGGGRRLCSHELPPSEPSGRAVLGPILGARTPGVNWLAHTVAGR
jgi:hypothetical protein